MSRVRALALMVILLGAGTTLPAQVSYPHTLEGCFTAADDQLVDCVDANVYPDLMCANTYDIVIGLCRVQYAQ